ncbi:MAG: hypothetical protein AAGB22_10690 [Bacteroidota bacterium]
MLFALVIISSVVCILFLWAYAVAIKHLRAAQEQAQPAKAYPMLEVHPALTIAAEDEAPQYGTQSLDKNLLHAIRFSARHKGLKRLKGR